MKNTVTARPAASSSNLPANTQDSAISTSANTGRNPSDTRRKARLTVDLSALTANYNTLRRIATRSEVAGIVKADAYGLGAAQVARALHGVGCRSFFVATGEEGAALRATLPEASQAQIYVLHGFMDLSPQDLAARTLIPVLSSLEDLDALRSCARMLGKSLPAAIHVDTGMNRLGLAIEAIETGLALDGIAPVLLMSHLACADEPKHPLNQHQRERFETVKAKFPGIRTSLANSAGILLGAAYHGDLVRPGIALYGANPVPDLPSPVKAVATLEAAILQIRDAKAGDMVGYGASHALERPTRLATLGIGYADGYLRSLGNTASACISGHLAPVLGRVSMDLTVIDVTDLPEALVRPGALAELFGPCLPLETVAEQAGTIPYELLTRLGQRLARSYLAAPVAGV